MKWNFSQGEQNESHTFQGLSLNNTHQTLSSPIFYIAYSIRDNSGLRKNIIHFHNPNSAFYLSFVPRCLPYASNGEKHVLGWIFFPPASFFPTPNYSSKSYLTKSIAPNQKHLEENVTRHSYRQSISKISLRISKVWLLHFSIYSFIFVFKSSWLRNSVKIPYSLKLLNTKSSAFIYKKDIQLLVPARHVKSLEVVTLILTQRKKLNKLETRDFSWID